jgi:hypothetical protein
MQKSLPDDDLIRSNEISSRNKVKVKLPLCLINYHAMKIYRGVEVGSTIPDPDTGWR